MKMLERVLGVACLSLLAVASGCKDRDREEVIRITIDQTGQQGAPADSGTRSKPSPGTAVERPAPAAPAPRAIEQPAARPAEVRTIATQPVAPAPPQRYEPPPPPSPEPRPEPPPPPPAPQQAYQPPPPPAPAPQQAYQPPPAPAPRTYQPPPQPAAPPPVQTGGEPRPALRGLDFAAVARRLTVDPANRRQTRQEWEALREKTVVGEGRVVDVEVGRRGFKVLVFESSTGERERFNVILIGPDAAAARRLAPGHTVRFRGVLHRAEFGTARRGPVVTLRDVSFF